MHPMLNIAVRAARAAGNFIAKSYEQLDMLEVESKGHGDYVSHVDRQAEQLIIDTIRAAYPEHSIIAEEAGEIRGKDADYQWIIDPLDGTTNFVRGIPHFAVSIALQVKGRIEQGVIYDPIRNELFTASRGQGAKLNERRIRASKARDLRETVIATGFPFKAKQHSEAYSNIFSAVFAECGDLRRAGSAALDLAYVAAGRCDGFFEIGLKPWDIAAGELIAKESGCLVTDFVGGHNYMRSGNIVAAPARVMKPLLATLRDNLTESLKK